MKATDGSKIYFKSENVSCEWGKLFNTMYSTQKRRSLWCSAAGVITELNGYTRNYFEKNVCREVTESGKELGEDWDNLLKPSSFPCTAARNLGKY